MPSSHQGPTSSAEVAAAANPSSSTRVVGGDEEQKDQLQNQDSASTMERQPSQEEASDFVNQGLQLWERTRDNWLAHHQNRKKHHHKNSTENTTDDDDEDDSSTIRAAIPLDVDEIIDVVFAPRWRGGAANGADETTGLPQRFSQNVPLPQMVDILQDLWEAEGLDV